MLCSSRASEIYIPLAVGFGPLHIELPCPVMAHRRQGACAHLRASLVAPAAAPQHLPLALAASVLAYMVAQDYSSRRTARCVGAEADYCR